MATDATLVNAAYREAMANVPKFDPNIAKSQSELVGNIMDPIAEAIETKAKAKEAEELELEQKNEEYDNLKDDQIAKFTNTADAINIRLSSFENGGRDAGMHEQIYNNTYDYLDELKQEYELYNTVGDDDTPENKKKRVEILGKLEGVKNSTIQLRTDVLAIGKLAGSKDGGSQMSKHGMTASEIAMTNEILNMDGDYNNVRQRWDNKTNSMFFDVTIPDDVFSKLPPKEQELGQTRTWSSKDIKENFYAIPKETEGNLIKQSGDYERAGKKAKWDDEFDLQMSADETTEILGNDKKSASHIFQTRQHGQPKTGYDVPGGGSGKWEKGSWANALEAHTDLNGKAYKLDPTTNMEIVTNLIKSGEVEMSEIDTDTSGDISNEELEAFMSTGNRDEVIDVLVNHKNPLYDHKLSVEEFSMWRAKQNETKFNENKPDKPEEKTSKGAPTSPGKPLFNPNQYFPLGQGDGSVTGGAINGMVNKIKVGRSFKFEDNSYDHVDGGWYLNYNDGTKEGEEKSTPESDNYIGDAETLIFNAFGEGGNDSRFNDITTKKLKIIDPESGKVVASSVDTRQDETFDTKTNLDINFLNKADEAVAAKLNDLIPSPGDTRNPNAYTFKPLGSFENLTGIYKEGGEIERFPKVYPEGHPKAGEKHPKADRQAHFKTKGKTTASNTENLAEMIDLLQTFGLYEYIPKQLP